MPKRYPNHAWNDRADKAYQIKAAKKKALEARRKREAYQKSLEAATTEPPENCRMLVTKIVHGES